LRTKILWGLVGAATLLAVELAVTGGIAAGVLIWHSRALPGAIVIPTPSAHAVVIATPSLNPYASRFTELPIPRPGGSPYSITRGPDGAMWFTEAECTSGIGRLSQDGQWQHWPLTGGCDAQPLAITRGPDGNLWFADVWSAYGRITPAGELTRFKTAQPSYPTGITAGPDGNLWMTVASPQSKPFIAQIDTHGDMLQEFKLPSRAGEPRGIVSGPDGAIWFTESDGIGRITMAGALTEFPLPQGNGSGTPYQIAVGPDHNLWFIEYSPAMGRIGRLTPSGHLTEFATPGQGGLQWITAGPDGALWFTADSSNTIGRITTSGSVTGYPLPSLRAQPVGITAGPDGNIWFTESPGDGSGKIGIFLIKGE